MTYRVSIGLLALTLAASNALACSCIQIGNVDPVSAVTASDAVFRARAVTTAMVLTNDDGAILRKGDRETPTGWVQQLVALRVEELFKGDVAPLTIVVTGSGAGDCGYAFEDGKEYLVYATLSSEKRFTRLVGSAKALTTTSCTFTRAVEGATQLLESIRSKFPPRQPVWVSWPE